MEWDHFTSIAAGEVTIRSDQIRYDITYPPARSKEMKTFSILEIECKRAENEVFMDYFNLPLSFSESILKKYFHYHKKDK